MLQKLYEAADDRSDECIAAGSATSPKFFNQTVGIV